MIARLTRACRFREWGGPRGHTFGAGTLVRIARTIDVSDLWGHQFGAMAFLDGVRYYAELWPDQVEELSPLEQIASAAE